MVIVALLMVLAAQWVVAADVRITSVTMQRSEQATVVRIVCDGPLPGYQKPERSGKNTILRIPDATIGISAIDSSCTSGPVRLTTERIRNITVMRFLTDHDSVEVRRNGNKELLVTFVHGLASKQSTGWDLDVIVIDAGHGGEDSGAEGVNGVYEKDVTLAIARALHDLIHKEMPKTQIVMTRRTDVFIPLGKRTDIANEAKGSIFISIHCNSMPTKPHPAHGCETYILRPGRNADATRVAARENASLRFESRKAGSTNLTEDQLILATMAQRSFVRFSEELAKSVQRHVSTASGLTNRGVSQAGFHVLVGASMPNILFETAFLSNENDAEYVSSAAGQQMIARSMLNAIKAYARTYNAQLNR